MRSIWDDARFTVRSLRRSAATTSVALTVLTIAICANVTLFTALNAVLLRPVQGVQKPRELVRLLRVQEGESSSFGYPDYVDYRDRSRSLLGIVAEAGVPMSFSHEVTERIIGRLVTGNYFSVLGVAPHIGRLLNLGDDHTPGAHPVAVLNYRFWRRAFGGDPAVIGRRIRLNGYAYEVVSVAAESFDGLTVGGRADVWIPMMMQRAAMPRYAFDFLPLRSAGWLTLFGRLRQGVSMATAEMELRGIAEDLRRSYPDTNRGRSVALTADVGLIPDQHDIFTRLFGYLFASVGLILLIACANLANLLLARAVRRKQEIAVRIAIGISAWRLARQLIMEAVVLAAAAAALGLALTPYATPAAMKLVNFAAPVSIDHNVAIFTCALVIVTALLCGVAPIIQAVKTDILSALKAGRQSTTPARGWMNVRNVLVVAQVALAFALLVAGGLLIRTMQSISAIDKGFSSSGVLLASVDLSLERYSETAGQAFSERLIRRLTAEPGVVSASISKSEPARDFSDRRPVFRPGGEAITIDANRITPDYFRTLGMQLIAGRDFSWQDRTGTPRVCIISERLAQKLWPSESAIGKTVVVPGAREAPRQFEVVGIARDSKYRSVLADPPLLLYEPLLQNFDSAMSIEIRTTGDPNAFSRTLPRLIASFDSNLAVYNVRTMPEQIAASLWQQRSATILVVAFAIIAIALASIGLYASLAYSVSTRVREIAIRMAIGAEPQRVLHAILGDAIALALAGLFAGAVVALPLLSLSRTFLYGVAPTDPPVWIIAGAVVIIIMVAASYNTARAATRIDPVIALREN